MDTLGVADAVPADLTDLRGLSLSELAAHSTTTHLVARLAREGRKEREPVTVAAFNSRV